MTEVNKQTHTTKKKKEPTYPKEELMQKSQSIFGYKPEILAGAFSGLDKKEFGIEETKKLIKKFLTRKV